MMNVAGSTPLKSAGSFPIVLRHVFDLCFNFFGRFILNTLYCAYKLFLTSRNYIKLNKSLFLEVFRTRARTDNLHDEMLIKNEVLSLKKVPQHLTLIVGAETPSYVDLVKFIKWSIPAGITHISFYDHRNGIDSDTLFTSLCKYARNYIPLIKWGKSFSDDIKLEAKNHINGFTWRPAVTVHIYKPGHWEDWILQCIRDFGSLEDCNRTGQDNTGLTLREVDSALRKHFLAPDPDLLLVAGEALSFFGFPPWFLRITQIQSIPSHHEISLETFLDSIKVYSISEQRYGK